MTANQNNQSPSTETATEAEPSLYRPSPEEIAERAHSHFLAGGAQHGNHVEHWMAAEADLLAERNI